MLTATEDIQLEAVVLRLEGAFPQLTEADVRAAVAAAAAELAEAKLRTFVPILVERAASAACRELAAVRGIGGLVEAAGRS